jgi:hypothetical protein
MLTFVSGAFVAELAPEYAGVDETDKADILVIVAHPV